MNLRELTEAMDSFVKAKGWYKTETPRKQTPRNLAISLNLEAAEILEHFQWREEAGDKEGLSEELADVALYLLQLARVSGIDLEQAILAKLEKNYSRTWDNEINNEGESK